MDERHHVPTWQVSCVAKRDAERLHERIAAIGGVGWRHSEAEAIGRIRSGTDRSYVRSGSWTSRVVVARHLGKDYLKTEADRSSPDSLIALPEC